MTWIDSTVSRRRAQLGPFMLGTGGIGGIAAATGPGLGLSADEGIELISRAVAEGFAALDTADIYTGGNSEAVVGRWVRENPDAAMLIQSKTGYTANGPDLSPDRIRRQLQASREKLGRLDLFITHAVDPATPWDQSLPVLSDAVEKGWIRAYGLSNVDDAHLTAALETADRLGIARPELIQNSYSLVERADDATVLPIVRAEGLAYTPYSPLANGLLAQRYSAGERPAAGSRASVASPVEQYLSDDALLDRVRRFDELARAHGISSAGLALAWLLNRDGVTSPIVAPSKETHWTGIREARDLAWTPLLADKIADVFSD